MNLLIKKEMCYTLTIVGEDMKRVLKILIVVLLFAGINVYAENKIVYNNDSYFFAYENDLRIGNWIPNNTYIFQSVTTSYNYATQQTTVIEMQNHYYRFYDENNNLIKETQPNLVDLPDGSKESYLFMQFLKVLGKFIISQN